MRPVPSPILKADATFSPVSLRYIAALRGNKPKKTGLDFTYAEAACREPEKLTCLAASNPEGRFYGMVADEAARRAAEEHAARRGIFNVIFLVGQPSEILARLANGSTLPPMLDYLCCDESALPLPAAEHEALCDLAQKRLNDGGLFVTSYAPYAEEDGALRFLVREAAPEMTQDEKQVFLGEIKKLGALYLSGRPDTAALLDKSIAEGTPDAFFTAYRGGTATSRTFDTMVAMRPRGMVYGGDAHLAANYVELCVPAEAQDLVVKCRNHVLYEPIKDLALHTRVRSDIWVKAPAERSLVAAELFGGFAYGMILPREDVPASFQANGKSILLSSPLYVKLIDLMAIMPIGVGDFLSHPDGAGEEPAQVMEALQILVACSIASPMRGLRSSVKSVNVNQPRLVGSFNRYLDKTSVGDEEIWLASSVIGCGVTVSARDALVMQALNRAGLSNSVSALMPELRRLADAQGASFIPSGEEPTPEGAQSLVREVVGRSLPQWYAYALLGAA